MNRRIFVLAAIFAVVVGGAAAWLFLRTTAESIIIGKWGLDLDSIKKTRRGDLTLDQLRELTEEAKLPRYEFSDDYTLILRRDAKSVQTAKWKVLSNKDNVLTIEVVVMDGGKRIAKVEKQFTIVDDDHIRSIEKVVTDDGQEKTGEIPLRRLK